MVRIPRHWLNMRTWADSIRIGCPRTFSLVEQEVSSHQSVILLLIRRSYEPYPFA